MKKIKKCTRLARRQDSVNPINSSNDGLGQAEDLLGNRAAVKITTIIQIRLQLNIFAAKINADFLSRKQSVASQLHVTTTTTIWEPVLSPRCSLASKEFMMHF
jgi:hypothetical protein